MSTGYPMLNVDAAAPLLTLTAGQPPTSPKAKPFVLAPRTGSDLPRRDQQLREMVLLTIKPAPVEARASDQMLAAPGVLMTRDEFAARFGGFPLDEYRARMTPEAFRVFVRFAGLVPAGPSLDLVQTSRLPEDPR